MAGDVVCPCLCHALYNVHSTFFIIARIVVRPNECMIEPLPVHGRSVQVCIVGVVLIRSPSTSYCFLSFIHLTFFAIVGGNDGQTQRP